MIYTYTLTIPANTPANDPVMARAKMAHGVITHVDVEFPPKCAGLAYAYVTDAIHQVFPTNDDGRLRTDGKVIGWNEYYELFYDPFELQLWGYNLDDTFQHQVLFRFELTSKAVAEKGSETASVVAKLRKVVGI